MSDSLRKDPADWPPDSVTDVDLITSENRRLRKEVAKLRQQIAAFESSRWWRLHPRLLSRKLRHTAEPAGEADWQKEFSARTVEPTVAATDPSLQRFHDEVVAHGTFTRDWFTSHISNWELILQQFDARVSSVLEIGSFEGLSACYLLWRLPQAHVTCVDTFKGGVEHVADGLPLSQLQELFDRNVALVDASRVRKLVGDSRSILVELAKESQRFDLVYVDGSHMGLDVIVDAALSWHLLAPRALMIFDDYEWTAFGDDSLSRPGPAIDAFLQLIAGHGEVVFRGGQLAVRKSD